VQTVTEEFDTASKAKIRRPVAGLGVSWLRNYEGHDWFTIGTSTIGGGDVIKGEDNVVPESDNYDYIDETEYLMSMEYDRYFDEPVFSVARSVCDVILDNNSDRFLPLNFTDELSDSYAEANANEFWNAYSGNVTGYAQTFEALGGVLDRVAFYIKKTGSPTGNITAKIYAKTGTNGVDACPTGTALATSETIDISTLETSGELKVFNFTGEQRLELTAGTIYAVAIEYTGGNASNCLSVGLDTSSPSHDGNYSYYGWGAWGGEATQDVCFYVYEQVGVNEITWDIKSRRPIRASAGFNYNGISNRIQQFVGMIIETPKIDQKENTCTIHAIDFTEALWGYPVERTQLYQDKRSDELIDILLQTVGLTTGQYILDQGLITIPFCFFEAGQKVGDIIAKICQAEQATFYVDENGIFRFENRLHLLNAPHTASVLTITDAIILKEENQNIDKIINVVEIKATPRAVVADDKQIWTLPAASEAIAPGATYELFINYEDPIFSNIEPTAGGGQSNFTANTATDGSGTNLTSDFEITEWTNFSKATKLVIRNNHATLTGYLTAMNVFGKPAEKILEQGLYLREEDATSVTDYDEHVVTIENDYIQSYATMKSIASSILLNRKEPGNYKIITIRGLPQLQLGDLVTRGTDNYFVIRIKSKITASEGFTQELTIVKRTISSIS